MTSTQLSPAALQVLVVDARPAVLRTLSKFLVSAGYRVYQASSGEQALAAIANDCPHYLIVDWDLPKMSGIDVCSQVRTLTLPHHLYIFLLIQQSSSCDLLTGLQAGADDFLSQPVVHGEVLTRLRAGARVIEYERRLAQQALIDPLTALPTRRAFRAQLARKRPAPNSKSRLSCVLLDVDFFKGFNAAHGHRLGDEVLRTIAKAVGERCHESDAIYRFGEDEFCIFRSSPSEAESLEWAEQCRGAIQQLTFGDDLHVTASLGVSRAADQVQDAESLVEVAASALQVAKESGRNHATFLKDCESESSFNEQSNATDVLERTFARHVMTPCVISLDETDTIKHAAELVRQCRLQTVPVVNAEGSCVGLVAGQELRHAAAKKDWAAKPVRSMMRTELVHYEEDTTIRALYDLFRTDPAQHAVIVHGGKPTGIVTLDNLAALSDQLTVDTFRCATEMTGSTLDLVVPDLVEAGAGNGQG
jgi:two-component system chemotaxis response regulator CheY